MLPRGVEYDLSLLPGVKRDGVTVELTFSEGCAVTHEAIYPCRFRSRARVSHDEVPKILASKGHVLHDVMARLMGVSTALCAQRRMRSAFVLYDFSKGWIATEDGHVKKVERTAEVAGHIIVQELMVAANAFVARYASERGVPILFRNHQAVGDQAELAEERAGIVALLDEAARSGESVGWLEELRRETGKKMHKAEYGASTAGHFGLNLSHYTHFTSPIRRYADLATHRQILAHVRGDPLPHTAGDMQELADHINSTLAIEEEAARERHKERATDVARAALDAAAARGETRRLSSLGTKDFERVVKVVVRSGEDCPEAFLSAFLERLAGKRASVLDRTLVLCDRTSDGPRWVELRQAIVDDLAARVTHDAPSILSTASNTVLGWTPKSVDVEHDGTPQVPSFTATVSGTRDWDGAELHAVAHGRASSEATHRAMTVFLAHVAGAASPATRWEPPETVRHVDPCSAGRSPVVDVGGSSGTAPRPVDVTSGKDPIMALGEHAQKHRNPTPSYTFHQDGPSNTPTITCACTYVGKTTRASAGRKQDAKRAASLAMLTEVAT